MPFVDPAESPEARLAGAQIRLPDPAEAASPDLWSVLNAAFRQGNTIGATAEAVRQRPDFSPFVDEGFDPFAELEERYQPYASAFIRANTAEDVARIKRQIDQELEDRRTLAAAGIGGLAAALAAGVADPLVFVPVGGQAMRGFALAREVALGTRVATAGLETARAGAIGAALTEGVLQATQATRTPAESVEAIGIGTLLAGALGAAAPAVREGWSRLRGGPIEEALARDLTPPPRDLPDPLEPGTIRLERAALGQAYDEVRTTPIGPADDPLVRLKPSDIDEVLVERGPVALRDGEVVIKGRGYGLVKVIFRHGEGSATDPALQVTRDDVLALPEILRRYEPASASGEFGAEGFRREWRVLRPDGAGGERVVIYATTRWNEADRLVTIYVDRTAKARLSEQPLSKLRPGADAEGSAGAPGSPAGIMSPDGDTPRGLPLQPDEGRDAPAAGNLGPPPDLDKADLERGGGGSLSAASVDEANLFERLKGALGLEKAIAWTNPLLRMATSPSVKARRWAAELADTPFAYEKNALGLASPVSVETMVKLWQAPLAEAIQATDAAFLKYRGATGFAALLRTGIADLAGRGGGKLTYDQFRDAVGQAMRRGDVHDIPEVAEAARAWRQRVFDPLKDRAIAAGLLPEDVGVETAASYLSRVYSIERIKAERPEFVRVATDWLEAEQVKRAGIQERIRELDDELDGWEADLRKVEARLRTLEKRGTVAGAKHEEARRASGEGLRRGEELLDRQREIEERLAQVSASIEALRAQKQRTGGAVLRELIAERRELREQLRGQATRNRVKGGEAEVARGRAARRALQLAGRVDAIADDQAKLQAYRDWLVDVIATTEMEIAEQVERWPGRAKTARQILNRPTDLSRAELEDEAQKITDHILGHPGGRNPYEGVPVGDQDARGPLKSRVFTIPDAAIERWLESDVELIGRMYVRTLAPDIELSTRFGDIGMTRQVEDLRASYVPLIREAQSEAERRRLEARRAADIRDLEAMRDRLRGTYAAPSDPDALIVRTSRAVRDINYLRLMGGMTLSAIPDLGRAVMVEGLGRVAGDGVAAMVRNWQGFKLAARETRLAGTALDMVLDTRAMSLADIGDDFGRHTKFERGLKALTNRFGIVSLMAPWNTAMKQFAGVVVQARILDAVEAWTRGAIRPKDIERLAIGGIDQGMAARIAEQFKRHGKIDDGVRIANTLAWDDAEAVRAFRAAVLKDTDRIIVTPGVGDRPLWMSTEAGKVVGQFKSFAFASTQRVALAGLQQRDAATLNGMLLMTMLGMGVYALRQGLRDDGKLSDNPAVWLAEGIDKSGITGWLFDVNNIVEKVSGRQIGISAITGGEAGLDRYASRNAAGALAGPSFGLLQDALTAIGTPMEEWSSADTRRLRRMLPMQNLFYLRRLLDAAEKGINEALGIPEAKRRQKK